MWPVEKQEDEYTMNGLCQRNRKAVQGGRHSPILARLLPFVMLPFFLLAPGCQEAGTNQKISGKVTFQGNPVTVGEVTFSNPGLGSLAQGQLDAEGNYTLLLMEKGMKPGTYKVTVAPKITYEKVRGRGGSDLKMVESGGKSIPRMYRNDATTRLKATVTEGEESFDFDLKGR